MGTVSKTTLAYLRVAWMVRPWRANIIVARLHPQRVHCTPECPSVAVVVENGPQRPFIDCCLPVNLFRWCNASRAPCWKGVRSLSSMLADALLENTTLRKLQLFGDNLNSWTNRVNNDNRIGNANFQFERTITDTLRGHAFSRLAARLILPEMDLAAVLVAKIQLYLLGERQRMSA